MIPFHPLSSMLSLGSLFVAMPAVRVEGGAQGELREAVRGRFRQVRADLDGSPDIAERIYQILQSTTVA